MASAQKGQPSQALPVDELDLRDEEVQGEPAEQLISATLSHSGMKNELKLYKSGHHHVLHFMKILSFLCNNIDIFIWITLDLPGIPPKLIVHGLGITQSISQYDRRNEILL